MTHKEKIQSLRSNSEMTQKLDLADKDGKTQLCIDILLYVKKDKERSEHNKERKGNINKNKNGFYRVEKNKI